MSSHPLAIIAGSANPELSADIAKYLGVSIGECVLDKFNDGTIFQRLLALNEPMSPSNACKKLTRDVLHRFEGETKVQILANVRGMDVYVRKFFKRPYLSCGKTLQVETWTNP